MTLFDWQTDIGETIVDCPDGWNGGTVRNTGGNIYCRTWRREMPNGDTVEVEYGNDHAGVGVNIYEDMMQGPKEVHITETDLPPSDRLLANIAVGIMQAVNEDCL